jgi:hypothetical protein
MLIFPDGVKGMKREGRYAAFKIYDAVKERPNIKAYLASDRRQTYKQDRYHEDRPAFPDDPFGEKRWDHADPSQHLGIQRQTKEAF